MQFNSLQPLGPIDGTLSCGDLITGAISDSAEVDLYTFTGQTNDVLTLTVTETSNWGSSTNDARVTVFTPTGAELITFDSNSQQQITLPEDGTYLVRVQANNLVSIGSYSLDLECLP